MEQQLETETEPDIGYNDRALGYEVSLVDVILSNAMRNT